MSSGQQAMWDDYAERAERAHKDLFNSNAIRHYKLVCSALESIERFETTDPSLTRYQHALISEALRSLRECFGDKR